MDKNKQKIWCIKSDQLFASGKWNGLKTDNLDEYLQLFREQGEFRLRGDIEEDPAYKQLIPVIILQVGKKFLIHRVTSAGNEQRLHELWPIMIGGHVEEQDLNKRGDIVENAALREFKEEVNYAGKILRKDLIGLVYIEDENRVNHMHTGLLFRYVGNTEDVHPHEAEVAEMHFVNTKYLEQNIRKLTYWSRLVIPLLKGFAKAI